MRLEERAGREGAVAAGNDVEHPHDRRHMLGQGEGGGDRFGRVAYQRVSGVDVQRERVGHIGGHAAAREPADICQPVLQPGEIVQVAQRRGPVEPVSRSRVWTAAPPVPKCTASPPTRIERAGSRPCRGNRRAAAASAVSTSVPGNVTRLSGRRAAPAATRSRASRSGTSPMPSSARSRRAVAKIRAIRPRQAAHMPARWPGGAGFGAGPARNSRRARRPPSRRPAGRWISSSPDMLG